METESSVPVDVLVVEDHGDTALSLAMLLHFWGHRVRVARDGPEALALAAEAPPEVVLLDIGMPGMDGWEAATRLRRLPGLDRALVVAVSGYGREDDRRHSHAAGCDLHLLKPVDPDVLLRLLQLRASGM